MPQPTHKILETLSGNGELRQAGQHLAKVFYHLQVRQALTTVETADAASAAEIAGEVTVSQDEPMQSQVSRGMNSGAPLTLYLADGRQLDVHATKGDAFTDSYRIVGDSPASFRSA